MDAERARGNCGTLSARTSLLKVRVASFYRSTIPGKPALLSIVYTAIIVYMKDIVHARLDPRTRQIMRRLQRLRGWSDSEIVRRGISALGAIDLPAEERGTRIVGLGKFESGVADLGSNPRHLHDFGR